MDEKTLIAVVGIVALICITTAAIFAMKIMRDTFKDSN
jgi:hypothetical protein